jgi:hypothetical protein
LAKLCIDGPYKNQTAERTIGQIAFANKSVSGLLWQAGPTTASGQSVVCAELRAAPAIS